MGVVQGARPYEGRIVDISVRQKATPHPDSRNLAGTRDPMKTRSAPEAINQQVNTGTVGLVTTRERCRVRMVKGFVVTSSMARRLIFPDEYSPSSRSRKPLQSFSGVR